MTIDEAIEHAEEVAEKNERRAETVRNRPISSADFYHEEESCSKCAEEHRQLAEWLKDYKRLLEQEHCEDCASRQSVNELFDSEIKMYKERIETRKGSNYHDETERIKEFRSRIANAEYWQNKIKALPPVTPKLSECEDAVSREDAIMCMTGKYLADTKYKAEDIISKHIRRLRALPPVTLTQKWIPISERLPEDYQRVLVTIVNYAGYKVVRVAEYNSGKKTFQIKENNERWKVGEKGLLAWQPLPDPYE